MPDPQEKNLVETVIQIVDEKKPHDVRELMNLTKQETHTSEGDILEQIIQLQNQGRISLDRSEAPLNSTPMAYVRSQAPWYWTTLVLSVATAASVFLIPEAIYPIAYLRIFLGIIFVFWLPGFSLTKALYPLGSPLKESSKSLDSIVIAALSLCLSFVLVPFIGLLLSYSPWGLGLEPIVLSLVVLTLGFSTIALARGYKHLHAEGAADRHI